MPKLVLFFPLNSYSFSYLDKNWANYSLKHSSAKLILVTQVLDIKKSLIKAQLTETLIFQKLTLFFFSYIPYVTQLSKQGIDSIDSK